MVHLKTILDTRRKKSDGTYPVSFRVTLVKQVKYINSGVSVKQTDWNERTQIVKKTHPNAQTLNSTISKKYFQLQKTIAQLENEGRFSFETLKDLSNPNPIVITSAAVTVKAFTATIIKSFIAVNRAGNAIVYQTALNRLLAFCKNENLVFEELDYKLLEKFKEDLLVNGKKINTVGNYFRSLRAIYNRAIKEKIISRESYPFTEIAIKVERTAKRAITKNDIINLEHFQTKPYSPEWHSLNFFLLSFYLIGMSFTDMAYLTTANIVNGRIEYRRRKTHKLYSIALTLKALAILDLYKASSNSYLLPVLYKDVIENSLQAKKQIHQWINGEFADIDHLISAQTDHRFRGKLTT